jgi:hypothetical protein
LEDLNELLIPNYDGTYIVGFSAINYGSGDNDLDD